MRSKLIVVVVLMFALCGCGKANEMVNTSVDKDTVLMEENNEQISTTDIVEEIVENQESDKQIIEDACTWLSIDIRSHTSEYGSYALFGNADIDLEFDYGLFKESMNELDKYNEKINSLSDEYSKIKESWNLSIEQLELLNEQLENTDIMELKEFDNSKFNQYSDALFDYARPIVYGE